MPHRRNELSSSTPDTTARSVGSDPVPLNIWPASPGSTDDNVGDSTVDPDLALTTNLSGQTRGHLASGVGLPVGIARRLVGTFTRPGELIVAVDPPPDLLIAAAVSARRFTALVTDSVEAEALAQLAETAGPATRRNTTTVIGVRSRRAAARLRSGPAVARLVIVRFGASDSEDMAHSLMSAAGRAVVAGGIVIAVLDPLPLDQGEDDAALFAAGTIIRAARDGGLRYLQHIVAVHTPIRGDEFDLSDLHVGEDAIPRDGAHIRAHTDLLVFGRHQAAAVKPTTAVAA